MAGLRHTAHPDKPARDKELAKALADEMAKQTGLRNRGSKTSNFHMCREVKASIPALLCEGGFMDSTTDEPVITSEKGQRAYAQAVVNVVVKQLGLKKLVPPEPPKPQVLYKVQIGAFANRANAQALLEEAKKKGFAGFIVESK